MKRAAAALVMLGIATATAAPSMAATTVYGSAQLKYTVNATASLSLSTNYTATGAQAAGAASILSNPAGNCSAGVAESTATLTFGGITPPASGMTGCYYKNAIGIGILSNDGAGVKVFEYTDTLAAGTAICVMTPTTVTPVASGSLALSGVAAAPAPATNATTCGAAPGGDNATALTAQGAATAGTGFGAAGAPGGTDVTATPTATTAGSVGFPWYSGTGVNGATYSFIGEDVQFNVSGTAVSGAATNVITVALVPQ
ncbi:MAG: hypothetical protein JOZ86_01860 [Candidatus Eremiobacteraeota bacterium]|nr:hypothetical protein [Candidatus Eremiobacteraeota bacterium]